jgi:16S rRNA (uracil1498-N3)-methyltransferase
MEAPGQAWFFCDEPLLPGRRIALDAAESRHAAGPRRRRAGDAVTVFDGRGGVAEAAVTGARAHRIEVEILAARHLAPALPPIHLAAALPRGDRLAAMISMATQLGIASFTPLRAERSVVRPGDAVGPRLLRVMTEACKQSRLPHRPLVCPGAAPRAAAHDARGGGAAILAGHPGGVPLVRALAGLTWAGCPAITAMIGPEGGFTDREIADIVECGAVVVSLGLSILRIETAATAMVAAAALHRAALADRAASIDSAPPTDRTAEAPLSRGAAPPTLP